MLIMRPDTRINSTGIFFLLCSCSLAFNISSTTVSPETIPQGSSEGTLDINTSNTTLSPENITEFSSEGSLAINISTSTQSPQTIPEVPSEEEENDVCFERLGCFSMRKPWKSLFRPVPTPWSPKDISSSVMLFTRNSNAGYNISLESSEISLKGSTFDPNRPVTVIITHGFASNGQSNWLHEMKDGYLSNVDANAFILDWGKGASLTNYLQVASNTRIVGAQLSRFVRHLLKNGLNTKKIHLIGHSLGSHIMSYCAKNISEITKIKRLTALDPAQPGFEGSPERVRLAPTDAEEVDVVHTDAKPFIPFLGFGMMTPVGTVDFYMNGGSMQPGCLSVKTPNITSLSDLLQYPCEVVSQWVSCSHGRSYEYFTASLNRSNCSFCGRKMGNTETFLKVTTLGRLRLADPIVKQLSGCNKNICNVLGLETFKLPSRGSFAVTTGDEAPFCEVTAEENRKLRSLLTLGLYDHIVSGISYLGKKMKLI